MAVVLIMLFVIIIIVTLRRIIIVMLQISVGLYLRIIGIPVVALQYISSYITCYQQYYVLSVENH